MHRWTAGHLADVLPNVRPGDQGDEEGGGGAGGQHTQPLVIDHDQLPRGHILGVGVVDDASPG